MMPLAHRIIPLMLVRGGALVKGKLFQSWRSVGHPLQAIRIHQQRGVDELMLLDVGATLERRRPDFKMIEKLTRECFTPLTIGGGVRSVDDVRDLLNAGADKIAIGDQVLNAELVPECVAKYGAQAIVGVCATAVSRQWVMEDAYEFALAIEALGVGEIMIQAIHRDGTMKGYDLGLTKVFADSVSVPVIASCGCGSYQHMLEAIKAGASAVAAGAFFLFHDATPAGAAEYLSEHGVEVRERT